MNKKIINDINLNIDDHRICTNYELEKKIIVKVDKGLLEKEKKITNELIEIGYSDLYMCLNSTLKTTVKYIKKVDLNKPFKQDLIAKCMGIPLDLDYLSSTKLLYNSLLSMVQILPFFDALFDKLNEVEKEFNYMISDNNFDDITISGKTTLLVQIDGLKQIKLSFLILYNCYALVLKNPQIKEFFDKWLLYYKKLLSVITSGKSNKEVLEYNELLMSRINKL